MARSRRLRGNHSCPMADEGSDIMASGEKPSWGGNFLEKFKRSPLARVIGAVAIVASAAGLAAGCESTSASGGPGYSLSANNIIERSKTGSPKSGWFGHCLPSKYNPKRCYLEFCDGRTLVGFVSEDVSTEYTEVKDIINDELIEGSFANDKVIPNYDECKGSTYTFKTTEENNAVKVELLRIDDMTSTIGKHSEEGEKYVIKKETDKSSSSSSPRYSISPEEK